MESYLRKEEIPCDLWIDGSFLTEEEVPGDIDIAIRVMDDVMQNLTERQDILLTNLARDHHAFVQGLDTFVFSGYWIGHPHYGSEIDEGYSKEATTWSQQFGKGQDDWLKGIVIIPVGESEIGLRIRS